MKLSPSSMVDNMPKLLRKLSLTIQHQTKFGKPNGLRLNLSASFEDEDIEHIYYSIILKLPLTKGLFSWANLFRYTRVGCHGADVRYTRVGCHEKNFFKIFIKKTLQTKIIVYNYSVRKGVDKGLLRY